MTSVTGVLSYDSDKVKLDRVTRQVRYDSYIDAGLFASVALVNAFTLAPPSGAELPVDDALGMLADVLAVDPTSVAMLVVADVPGFVTLARRLRAVFDHLNEGALDAAARELNHLLAAHPAHPHLANEGGRWRLHHHPTAMELVPMWTSICAENLARVISAGDHERLGTCEAKGCRRVFVDESKNASRRFCSTTCQNRVKTAAFRRRQGLTSHR
jgi:predicted RNA-binding Zn ribbon-like protein